MKNFENWTTTSGLVLLKVQILFNTKFEVAATANPILLEMYFFTLKISLNSHVNPKSRAIPDNPTNPNLRSFITKGNFIMFYIA
jgi:hypothetical protein